MTIIKKGCICGGDYYTTTEQCDNNNCNSERKEIKQAKDNLKKMIEELLKKGFYSWEKDNLISLDGTNITLKVEDN